MFYGGADIVDMFIKQFLCMYIFFWSSGGCILLTYLKKEGKKKKIHFCFQKVCVKKFIFIFCVKKKID